MVIYMRLGDLQEKDIVNINDGKKVGRIIDAEVNESISNNKFNKKNKKKR